LTSLLIASGAARSEPITLFYPGKYSLEWILSDHEGAKQFRQGSSCISCHEGDAADMGQRALTRMGKTSASQNPHIKGQLSFTEQDGKLQLEFRFPSPKAAFSFSFMFDDDRTRAFERAGCWAVCHDDMRGMPADRGLSKYLGNTRQKVTRTGGGEQLKPASDLHALLTSGSFLELWTIDVSADGNVLAKQTRVFDKFEDIKPVNISAAAHYDNGNWILTISRALVIEGQKTVGDSQSFGVAVHADTNQDGDHWVSLPWRFGTTDGVEFKISKLK